MMDPIAVLFGSFALMLVLGVPIAYSLGLSSAIVMLMLDVPLSIIAQTAYHGLDSFVLLAVPFFMLVGVLMTTAGLTDRLLELARAMFGRSRGATGKVNVVASCLFGGVSGSSVADVAGIGSVLIRAMIKEGYPPEFAVAVTAASSTISIILPPSIFLVVYGSLGNISIGALFLAGVVPGVLIAVTQIAYCAYLARRDNHPRGEPFSIVRLLQALRHGILPFGVTVIVIGGIRGGWFTATEAAVIAVVYALALGALVYRSIGVHRFLQALGDATEYLGPTLFCVAMGMVFGWVMSYLDVPALVGELVQGMELPATIVLLMVMILFVIVGTFESGVASIVIFLPIIQPMTMAVGLDQVHVGIIVCTTLALGLITPPYGLCLLLAARIGNISVEKAVVSLLPWIGIFLAVVVAMVFFPAISLALPRWLVPEFMN